jgi:YVTN family beta-propeller protein
VWVSNSAEGTVSRIDTRTNRVVKTFRAGSEPNGLLYAHGALWVGDYGGSRLLRVDPATGRVTRRWTIAKADWITASPGALWVSSEPGRIVRIDPATGAVRARIEVGANPFATAWIGGELWVPSIDDDSISIVDPATKQRPGNAQGRLRPGLRGRGGRERVGRRLRGRRRLAAAAVAAGAGACDHGGRQESLPALATPRGLGSGSGGEDENA